jgi:hypothetical protein
VAAHPSRRMLRILLRMRRFRRAQSRRAQRTVAHNRIHDVKQRSVVRSRGALLRPGLCVSSQVPSLLRPPASPRGFGASGRRDSSDSVPPMRGDGAPTGALFLSVAPATRDHPVPGRPGPLSALHRGGFRMRTHEAGSRQWDRSRQRLPAPRHNGLAVGIRTSLRCGSRRVRGTPLLAPSFRIVSRKRPSEPGYESLYYKLDT